MRVPISLHPCQHLLLYLHSSGISLWHSFIFPWWLMISIFSCAYWPFVYFLCKNVHSNPFPIFKLSCLSFYCWVVTDWTFIRYMICHILQKPLSLLPAETPLKWQQGNKIRFILDRENKKQKDIDKKLLKIFGSKQDLEPWSLTLHMEAVIA